MRKITKGIIIFTVGSVSDFVLTNLGFSRKITSIHNIFPMTIQETILNAALLFMYVYGVYLIIFGIVQLVKRRQ